MFFSIRFSKGSLPPPYPHPLLSEEIIGHLDLHARNEPLGQSRENPLPDREERKEDRRKFGELLFAELIWENGTAVLLIRTGKSVL